MDHPSHNPKFKAWLKNQLRRTYRMMKDSPASTAWTQARVGYGRYKCNVCTGIFGPTEMAKDHNPPIEPIEPVPFSWDTHIHRLCFGHIQIVCKPCHAVKTKAENTARRKALKNAQ